MRPQPDSPELRKWYARRMIEETLIAREAAKNNLIDSTEITPLVKRDRDLFLRRRYLEVTLKDTITVSDEALKTAFARQSQRFWVRQVYGRTQAEINQLYTRLQENPDIAALAMETLPDEQMAAQGGAMGWVGWGDTDLPVEEVLYDLEKGKISKPVQSLVGWHIFRIDSVQVEYKFNSADIPFELRDLKHKLVNRKLDIAAASHLRELVWGKDLAVNAKLFQPLWQYMSPLLPTSTKELAAKGYYELENNLQADFGQEVLARVDGEPFTVAEFIAAIPMLPRNLLEAKYLKKAIEVAIRDKVVTEAAIAGGFAKDPVVQEKSDRSKSTFQYYAALAVQDSLVERRVNLRQYYDGNKNRYIDYVESEIEEILVKDRAQALALAKEIHAGGDFAALAENYTLRQTAKNGYRGFLSSKEDPLAKRAAKLVSGNIFAPIKTKDGYSVIRVGKQKKHYLSYEAVKQRLATDAQESYYEQLHESLLPATYDPADIVYYDAVISKGMTEESTTIF